MTLAIFALPLKSTKQEERGSYLGKRRKNRFKNQDLKNVNRRCIRKMNSVKDIYWKKKLNFENQKDANDQRKKIGMGVITIRNSGGEMIIN